MAMTTPTGQYKSAFDVEDGSIFEFITSGGNQIFGNILKVYNLTSQEPIYTHQEGSPSVPHYSFDNTIEPNAQNLVNGTRYYYTIQTFDSRYDPEEEQPNEHISNESKPIGFWCFDRPTVEIDNITEVDIHDNKIVNASSYAFNAHITTGKIVDEEKYELVNSIKFDLYQFINDNVALIDTSGVLTAEDVERAIDGSFDKDYTFSNLENDVKYEIHCTIETENRTIATTSEIFIAKFESPSVFTFVELENHCDDGYISIKSNASFINGKSYPSPPEYINNNSVYLIPYGHYVKWDEDFAIPNDFLLRLKVSIGRLNENFCILGDNGNYFALKWIREKETTVSDTLDYIELVGYENYSVKVIKKSNSLTPLNNFDNVFIWLKKVGDEYELIVKRLNETTTQTKFQWIEDDGVSNIVYERNSTLVYDDLFVTKTPIQDNIESINISPIKNIQISNGIFSLINVTSDTSQEYDPVGSLEPIWTYNTILNCNFHNNIAGGSLDQMDIQRVLVQRRTAGEIGNYITIADIPISQTSDLSFTIRDYFVPSGINLEYFIIPISSGDILGDRIKSTITSQFNAIHISDKEHSFKLLEGYAYGTISKVVPRGVYQTLGLKYPVVIQNGASNYYSGSVTGRLMGYDYMNTRKVDYKNVSKQAKDFLEFLSTNTAKVITDWRGNIWVCRVTDNPNMTEENGGVINVSFSFDEQGKWDNQEDLIESGLIKQ